MIAFLSDTKLLFHFSVKYDTHLSLRTAVESWENFMATEDISGAIPHSRVSFNAPTAPKHTSLP